ncbi:hypothetical protein GCM10010251_93040 [Streptomyces aurantiogriseus]|uniref:Uncharacterized protein n=1 Tax=Streptomyces aurantiogriseus TaxID=66870 RepID=A0A918FNZ5_9ACTN|nr:hypothetical protein GCM10010251_93040 [Streptomyces aurantiogriseus]
MCDRCHKPIHGKPDTYEHASASAGGVTLFFCPGGCRPAPHQRIPEPPVELSDPLTPASNPRRRRG